jgi:iron complex outermembrane receptor protein
LCRSLEWLRVPGPDRVPPVRTARGGLNRVRSAATACVVTLVCVLPARADKEPSRVVPDTVYTVPGIVVEAPRIPLEDDALRRSGFVAVLDMGDRRDRVEDLSTVLSQMIGIRVRQYGGLGRFATVSIRGSSANQVDLFVDGVPLKDAYLGVTNLGDLPLDGIDRIEVFRGFTPPQLGSSSIGGAINLVTQGDKGRGRHSPIAKVEARQSYGSFDTSRLVVSLWSHLRAARLFVHGSRLKSQGDFDFINDKTTPHNPADDAITTRVNNDFESWNLLGRLAGTVPSVGELSLHYNSVLREQGVPGVGSFQSRTARSERNGHMGYLHLTPRDGLSGSLQTLFRGFYSFRNEKFHDPSAEITLVPQDTDNVFHAYGGSARARLDVPHVPVAVAAFYEAKKERYHPKSHLPQPSEGPERNRMSQTTVLSGDLYLLEQDLVLSATARILSQSTEFYDPPQLPRLPPGPQGKVHRQATTPHYGFRWHPASFVTIKGNWGRSFRQPSMLELFGNVGSVTGSADLEPEKGLNRDIGAVVTSSRWGMLREMFVEVVYLDNQVENLILFFPNSQFTSRAQNIGSARIRGLELSFSTKIGDRLRLAGNYSHLDSKDTGDIPFYHGNELPGRPQDDVALFVDVSFLRWNVSYELHRIGKNYLDPANQKLVPAREIHSVAVRLNLGEKVSLTTQAQNLTDDRISDVSGFPLPGRSFYVTLAYRSSEGI